LEFSYLKLFTNFSDAREIRMDTKKSSVWSVTDF
jgi:hypothetical protein